MKGYIILAIIIIAVIAEACSIYYMHSAEVTINTLQTENLLLHAYAKKMKTEADNAIKVIKYITKSLDISVQDYISCFEELNECHDNEGGDTYLEEPQERDV